jgi:hypothetical protein
MNRYVIPSMLVFVCLFAGVSSADTPKGGYAHARDLTSAETASVSSLTPFTPPANPTQWGVAVVAKDAPINFVGLPTNKAFTRTTLVYCPTSGSGGDNPTAVTMCLMWPEGSRDAQGNYRNMVRVEGVCYDAGGLKLWLFDIEDHLNALRNEGAEWYFQQTSSVRAFLHLTPGIFTDGTAWAHVDPRLGNEQIDIGAARPRDGGRGMTLRPRTAK